MQASNEMALLPCPFCGCQLETDHDIHHTAHPRNDCIGARVSFASDRLDCIKKWNTRAALSARSVVGEDGEDAARFRWLLFHFFNLIRGVKLPTVKITIDYSSPRFPGDEDQFRAIIDAERALGRDGGEG
ncbi:Lar family restriction alleviation protein [Acidisoma cellulosilytica]|uniref:Lar family restriction alleviation protein n=1 Tax=Acidisoma cellulosilyticum TaxID=2802395 RepID=A0A964E3A3_9PROT|nr:hypothetical protein [Acidisoma cellulosilyticum]MCB8880067.1 Lar family restriction alleviation protein [Acidisoma cellulosilyticum]